MYLFKEIPNFSNVFKNRNITQKEASERIGITEEHFSRILNRKKKCRKVTAYSITKFFDEEAIIEDYFEKE